MSDALPDLSGPDVHNRPAATSPPSPVAETSPAAEPPTAAAPGESSDGSAGGTSAAKRRRRGSRGGRSRSRAATGRSDEDEAGDSEEGGESAPPRDDDRDGGGEHHPLIAADHDPSAANGRSASTPLSPRPKIGDSRPAPLPAALAGGDGTAGRGVRGPANAPAGRRRGAVGRSGDRAAGGPASVEDLVGGGAERSGAARAGGGEAAGAAAAAGVSGAVGAGAGAGAGVGGAAGAGAGAGAGVGGAGVGGAAGAGAGAGAGVGGAAGARAGVGRGGRGAGRTKGAAGGAGAAGTGGGAGAARASSGEAAGADGASASGAASESRRRRRRGRGKGAAAERPIDDQVEVDAETLERRRGRERKGRPVGRYLMLVHVQPGATQIAVLEGRSLIEHYVSRPADDATQIDGNIYLGRVQNVLPGMEAAFVDIGTPKNAVLYRGDVRYDREDVESDGGSGGRSGRHRGGSREARIEQLLKVGQTILCQVTKNPIGTKGARLSQEVSLPGRFVVLIPNSDTYGISKRLADDERKRLRRILDEIRPPGHGLIVRTAAEDATADELRRDVARLLRQWEDIEAKARRTRAPALLYREPDMAVRVIREEFNNDYRGVVIDDKELFAEVRDYVTSISPELADRVEYAGDSDSPLPIFERYRVHEQVHKALDRKVWLPSGGSLIIERTEALTVIDVNTGKNVGTSNLEETVFRNNLEAAEEIARQLRLRDIGGIIVIDFIDMEIAANRAEVARAFREALSRDKTRTQVFDISELGLVEMTRKRVSEGLVESFSETCPTCGGRGILLDQELL